MSEAPMIQAMVWYREKDWNSLLEIFSDAHLLPKTYEQWLTLAERNREKAGETGDTVVKVYIDPETFPAWCSKRGKPCDADARTQFAIEEVTRSSFGERT